MKRIISLLLVLALCLALCACGAQDNGEPKVAGEGQVLDGAGRVLDIPDDPQSATIASVYAVSVPFIKALGLTDRVLAVNTKSKFWTEADENLAKAGTVGRGVVDLEKLAGYSPTVLIHRSNDPETVEAVEKLGIDVLCITVENMDDFKTTLLMLGEYFGVSERAQRVVDWLDGKFDFIAERVAQIPESERVTALLMGGEPGRVAGNDMLQSWMIEQAGGICVADKGKDHNWIDVGVETVFEWDPEFVFCTSSTGLEYSAGELMDDSSWSAVKAVKNGKVVTVPSKLDSWDMPGLGCVLGTMFMLHEMYPDYFSTDELQEQIDEYYEFMFGTTFDADYLGYTLE